MIITAHQALGATVLFRPPQDHLKRDEQGPVLIWNPEDRKLNNIVRAVLLFKIRVITNATMSSCLWSAFNGLCAFPRTYVLHFQNNLQYKFFIYIANQLILWLSIPPYTHTPYTHMHRHTLHYKISRNKGFIRNSVCTDCQHQPSPTGSMHSADQKDSRPRWCSALYLTVLPSSPHSRATSFGGKCALVHTQLLCCLNDCTESPSINEL